MEVVRVAQFACHDARRDVERLDNRAAAVCSGMVYRVHIAYAGIQYQPCGRVRAAVAGSTALVVQLSLQAVVGIAMTKFDAFDGTRLTDTVVSPSPIELMRTERLLSPDPSGYVNTISFLSRSEGTVLLPVKVPRMSNVLVIADGSSAG